MAMMSSSPLFPNCRSVSQPHLRLSASPLNGPSAFVWLPPPSKLTVKAPPCSASTSSPPPPAVDEEPFSPTPSQSLDSGDGAPFSGCKACAKAEIERGCNGEGRIQGGIATVPGFGWWPIKAYRPCPGFVASGGRYFRRGQSMDEVVSGGGGGGGPATYSDSEDDSEPSKKRRDPRRFKR